MRVITNKMLIELGYYPSALVQGFGKQGYILFKEYELSLPEQKGLERIGFVRDISWTKGLRYEVKAGYKLEVKNIPPPKDPWDEIS